MATTTWQSDPTHSELGFKIKHLMISNVSGSFSKFEVHASTAGENNFDTAKIKVNVDVASIGTGNEQRDQHLRTSDFFAAETFPQITFESDKIEKSGNDGFLISGKLTMKGISHPVSLTAEYSGTAKDPWGNIKAGFSISGKINRKDWGVNFNAALETGGVMLGEEVKIVGEIQLVKQVVTANA